MLKKLVSAAALLLAGIGAEAGADDYDRARDALDRADYPVAIDALADLAEDGDHFAGTVLSYLLMSRVTDGATNGLAALAWLDRAAEDGSILAMLQSGLIYRHDTHVFTYEVEMIAAGYGQAIDWFERAASIGWPEGHAQLGRLYWMGLHSELNGALSAEQEVALALENLEIAAQAGIPHAQASLSWLVQGDDPDRALELLREAGAAGDAEALGRLVTVAMGQSVLELGDPVEAYKWVLAARIAIDLQGDPHSPVLAIVGLEQASELDPLAATVAARLSGQQRAEAEAAADALVAGWMSNFPFGQRPGHDGEGDYATVRAALEVADYPAAIDALADMAEEGDTLASTVLAYLMMSRTTGPSANGFAALAWLEKAAADGSAHAMLTLGLTYQYTPAAFGLPPQIESGGRFAADWFQRAIDAGAPLGDAFLGMVYRIGMLRMLGEEITGEEEKELAIAHLGRAAEAGVAFAHAQLAVLARFDEGKEGMLRWTLSAAALGDGTALGTLVADSQGDGRIIGLESPVDGYAWAVAAQIAIQYHGVLRDGAYLMTGVDAPEDFDGIVRELADRLTPEEQAEAEARGQEIASGWMSYMPDGPRPGFGGGLFGRN